ncbi:MAG: Crp/Fnr family transcriptional regulator [Novosphingobium sp.]
MLQTHPGAGRQALGSVADPLARTASENSGAHPLQLLLRKLETHALIPNVDGEALLALPHRIATIEPQGYVVREGDCPNMTGVLLAGFAFRQKLTGQGTRQIVALQIPGDPLDFQNLFFDHSDHSVQALTRARVALIPRVQVQRLMASRPSINRAIVTSALVEASISREWIVNIGRRDARSRLAHMLCEWLVRLEAQGLIEEYGCELPMTQEQIADALGLTSVHVNRMLKILEGEGVLLRDRGRLSFPDREKLLELAKFNPRYLHLCPQQTGVI